MQFWPLRCEAKSEELDLPCKEEEQQSMLSQACPFHPMGYSQQGSHFVVMRKGWLVHRKQWRKFGLLEI